jgi:hypothetical protein
MMVMVMLTMIMLIKCIAAAAGVGAMCIMRRALASGHLPLALFTVYGQH